MKNLQLGLFCLIQVAIILAWLHYTNYTPRYHPDVELYFEYASFMAAGDIPYRDFSVEYPPLSLLFMLLPLLFVSSIEGYADVFAGMILVFNTAGLVFVSSLSRKLGLHHTKTLTIYTLAFFALGDITINRFDVIPAILTLVAIYYHVSGKNKLSWLFLGLGALVKLYPLILAPIFGIYYLQKKQYRPLLKGLSVFSITGMAVALPIVIINFSGFWEFIDFHLSRGLQIESGYASVLILANKLGLTDISVVSGRASMDVEGPGVGFFLSASAWFTMVALSISYWLYYRSIKNHGYSHEIFISFSLGIIALLIITSKVFSPQFVIWLYPFVCLVGSRQHGAIWIIFVMIGLMSSYIFPYNYGQLINLEQPAVAFLWVRNILVFCLGVLVLVAGYRTNVDNNTYKKMKLRRTYF